ncbi:MAG: homoserine kinase [Melioribacteraceae bacterium]|jgi:homoserine kinase|nr:homoserine kinase [Melioribacteraceae bacterium]
MKSIKVFAPASVSNVGPGFDILGFALNEPGDEIVLTKTYNGKIEITNITGDDGKLPYDVEKNTASVAIKSLVEKYEISDGVSIEVNKKMGLGSGLGSSAASAVGAVFAFNELFELNLSNADLLPHALAGEFVASKAIHADNVAPSLYGGFILIRGYNPIDIIKIKSPKDLFCTIIYPNIEIKTREARAILPKDIPLKNVVSQTGNVAALIYGLATDDYSLISRSLNDVIIEPVRSKLISGYYDIKKTAMEAGALGCNISGSGPSMFALSNSEEVANRIALETKRVVTELGIGGVTYVSQVNQVGPKILD